MKNAKFTKTFTVALHPGVFEKIKLITDNQQISMAEWVRNAVDQALKKNSEDSSNA
mgnify:CR=1 FL=1